MPVLSKNILYFITDKAGRCKYVDSSGTVQTSSPPIPLPQHPKGWKEMQVGFGTNAKYFMLNRSFVTPMFFVGDGAIICREALWAGKGYQEELYVVILKLNPQTGVYELEYKGRLDFGKAKDEPRKGVTVNAIEGGVLQYLANNDNVQYEILLDVTNPDCIQCLFTGVALYDRYRYSEINVDIPKLTDFNHHTVGYTIPIAFISNEGDSVGVVKGTQQYHEIAFSGAWTNSLLNPYCVDPTSAANSPVYSVQPITIKSITGNLVFDLHYANASFGVWILIQTSLGNRYNILGTPSSYVQYTASQTVTVPINLTNIPLAANEVMYIIAVTGSSSTSAQSVTWQTSDIYMEFSSINPPSKAYFIQPLYLWRQLIAKMTTPVGGTLPLYSGDSDYFAAHNNIAWTSTNALRNFSFNYFYGSFETIDAGGGLYQIKIPGTLANFPDGEELIISGAASNNGGYTVISTSLSTVGFTVITVQQPVTNATIVGQISTANVIKISVEDFFNDVDCDKPMCLQLRGEVLNIEPIADCYKPDTQIFDVGEITDLELSYRYDWLCNTGLFGSKSQDYRQRNGRYEFNTTTLFQFPVDTLKKPYTKITKSRRDCFGIEFIRSLIFDKPTTDSTGDNQNFMVDLVKGVTFAFYTGAIVTQDISGTYFISIYPPINTAILSPGQSIVLSGAASNNGTYTISNIFFSGSSTDIQVVQPVTPANINGVLSINDPNLYQPYRPAYSSITGVLDNTVFNTTITPHHQLINHGPILGGLMFQLGTDKVVYRTSDKNGDLVTTLAGVTLAEKQDEVIAGLGTPLFYPYSAVFKLPVPISFAQVMISIRTGYIKGTYIGVPIYFLPIGKMDARPATNEPQLWELVLAGPDKNSLDTIKLLSLEDETIMATDGIFTSFLSAVHWLKYDHTLPAKYSHMFIDDDWLTNRNTNYTYNPPFFQKWQTSESIPMQAITRGLGQLTVTVYDSNGHVYGTPGAMAITTDPAVITPKVRQDYLLDISAFADGYYYATLRDGDNILRITDPWYIKASHENTLLFEYDHTTNKYGYYWTGIPKPNIRLDATLLEPFPDSTQVEYQDEIADTEMIDGIPVMKQVLTLGNAAGVPSWQARQASMMLLLNGTSADGLHISRTPDSKVAPKVVEGYPLYAYDVEVMEAHQKYGLITDATGNTGDITVVATLDAQGFGSGTPGAVIDIEMPNIN